MLGFKTTIKSFFYLILFTVSSASVYAEDIGGRWCTKDNRVDCIIINVSKSSPEIVTAKFEENGKVYAEATGFFRDGNMVLSFRRINKRDIGFVTFHLRDGKTADARTFNPDGSQRWQGIYIR